MIPEWIDAMDAKVRTAMRARGSFSPAELAEALGFSEGCACLYITLLVEAGRLRIDRASVAAAGATVPAAGVPRAA